MLASSVAAFVGACRSLPGTLKQRVQGSNGNVGGLHKLEEPTAGDAESTI